MDTAYENNFIQILKTISTTKLRTTFDEYVKGKGFKKWNYGKENEMYYCSEYDCKRRLRTICRFKDDLHELNITLRKKSGYYLIIELDRKRIFECDPDILVNEKEKMKYVLERYGDLFEKIFNLLKE